jgi:Ca2+-binding EF-hand superfamily protein
MKSSNLIVGLGLMLLCVPAFSGDKSEQDKFNRLDTNKDGYVSIEEATGNNDILSKWSDIDKNSDGQLEYSEFSAFETMGMKPEKGDSDM